MGQRAGKATTSGGGPPGNRGGSLSADDASEGGSAGHRPGTLALPANLERSLRRLANADLDRLVEAANAEARRRGRRAGKTSGGRAFGGRGRDGPAPVTPGQEKLILVAFEAGLKPAAIARELWLSRTRVDNVLAGAGHGRR